MLLQVPQRKAPLRTAVNNMSSVSACLASALLSKMGLRVRVMFRTNLHCTNAEQAANILDTAPCQLSHLGWIMSCIWHSTSSKRTGSWLRHSIRCSCSS